MLHTICFFFFNDTATTEIYTLSLHDALPIWLLKRRSHCPSLISRGWVKSTGGKLTRPHMLRESEVHGIDGRSRARPCGCGHRHLHLLHRRTSPVRSADRKSTRLNSSHGYISYA